MSIVEPAAIVLPVRLFAHLTVLAEIPNLAATLSTVSPSTTAYFVILRLAVDN